MSTALTLARTTDPDPALVAYLTLTGEGSHRAVRGCLRRAARTVRAGAEPEDISWSALTARHVMAMRAALLKGAVSPATANATLSTVRGVAKAAFLAGAMTGATYMRIKAVPGVKGSRVAAGRFIEPGEVRALFRACDADKSAAGTRDAAILACLFGGGLRRAEVSTLDVSNFDVDGGTLLVMGKGNKQRLQPFSGEGRVAAWVERYRGTDAGPLFTPIGKASAAARTSEPGPARLGLPSRVRVGSPMSPQAVYDVLRKRAAEAGITKRLSPHDGRRTFISSLLDAGVDLATASRAAGHEDVQTTSRYDRRGERAVAKAVAKIDGIVPEVQS